MGTGFWNTEVMNGGLSGVVVEKPQKASNSRLIAPKTAMSGQAPTVLNY